jgi:cytochrome c oxidase subunit 2
MWALFFAVNMLAMAALCFAAPAMGWWMPTGLSTHAKDVESLFNVILIITTFFFFLTEALLIVFMWKYDSTAKEALRARTLAQASTPGEASVATPGPPVFLRPLTRMFDTQHKVELAWTIVPAAILLYIAFAQVGAWARIKYQSRIAQLVGDKTPVQIDVSARQFEWRMRYPSAERMREWLTVQKDKDASAEQEANIDKDMKSFARFPQADDVHVVNELHVWQDNPALIHLSTLDVLHSFNLPHFRVKQDALPGKVIPVWFTPTLANVVQAKDSSGQPIWYDAGGRDDKGRPLDQQLIWDIPCAELCGWGHFRMIGRVYVHPSEEDFLSWLTQAGKSEYGRVAPSTK